MKSLKGKVAAITGAASGIGRATAIELAKLGCHVAIADMNEEGLLETQNKIKNHSQVTVTTRKLDVSQRAEVEAWASEVVQQHGHANIVMNNAGVSLMDPIETMKYEDFEWLMNINFWGVVYGTKAFLPHLINSGDGHIVNISSVFGMIGVPTQSAYNAAKFAVKGFTESLIEELELTGNGVKATCVHPGGIKTNIARNGRLNTSLDPTKDRDSLVDGFDQVAKTSPQKAAQCIIEGILKEKRRVLIGTDARIIDGMQRLLPTTYQKIVVLGSKSRM